MVSFEGQAGKPGTIASRSISLLVGDRVDFHEEAGELFISAAHARKNILSRSYRGDTKAIVANVDLLLVVSAVPPLLNTLSIDRMCVVAHSQAIPWALVINKSDLGLSTCAETIEAYERIGVRVLTTAAKFGPGLEDLQHLLEDASLSTVALCGLSGVGKSTLINRLIPAASRATAEVSLRTGQGKQTTSQASGFILPRAGKSALVVVDLPGIQQFGVEHLTRLQVAEAFPEIIRLQGRCEFSDCAHIAERRCAVRDSTKHSVSNGGMATSRYESYCHMCQEIEDAKPY
jgi:ribosome biogenesis GTPase